MSAYLNAKDTAQLIDKAARPNGHDWWARCPAHEDHRASLCISSDGRKTLFYCAANCTQKQILAAIEQKFKIKPSRFFCEPLKPGARSAASTAFAHAQPAIADAPVKVRQKPIYCGGVASLRPPANHEIYHHDHLRHTATWKWHDAHGRLLAVTARFEDDKGGKDVLPFSPWCSAERPNQIEWQSRTPPGVRPLRRTV